MKISVSTTNSERKTIYCLIKDKMELELVLISKKHLNYIHASQDVDIRIWSFALNRVIRHFHDKKDNSILIFRKNVSVTSPCFHPGDILGMNSISTLWQSIHDIPSECSGGD